MRSARSYLVRELRPWLLVLMAGLAGGTLAAQTLTNLNLQLVSNVKPSANPISYGDVWAEDDLACLGVWLGYNTYNYGVGIYSISNPAAPVLLSVYNSSPLSQNQFELGALRNRIGYFGSWSGGGVHIVSLTNPAAPQLLSRIGATTGTVTNGFDRVHTVFLERVFLYLAAHVPGLVSVKVFDVSNPTLPVFLQDIVTTNTTKVHQMTVRNKGGQVLLYTSGWGGADNSNPSSPGQTDIWDVTATGSQPAQWLGRIYSGYNSHSSWPTEDGNTLIVCRETTGGDVKFYDISNPAAIPSNAVPFVTLTPASMGIGADIPHNPVVIGNFLFLSWYQNGVQVFDISDVTQPVRVGFYDTFPGPKTSSYQGNWGVFPQLGFDRILLSDIQSGLFVLDGTALLSPQNNYPPLIVKPPTSLTVTQGVTVTFAPVVTGSALQYQWLFNGALLPGATSSNLTLLNVQAAQAGTYALVVSNATAVITSATASLSVTIPEHWQTVFADDFDSAASGANWDLFHSSGNGIPDYTADWAFDYSSYFSAFNGTSIPPSPISTNATTRGLRLTVNNNDASAATAGVSLYPKNQFFSGAYRLKFDVWINYPGGPGGSGSSGSTEHFTCGLNHAGTRVNWASATANPSDGLWFALDGEGGTSDDYRAYVGNSTGSPTLLSFANSGFSASGASGPNNSDPVWQNLFPAPTYESPGAPGKHWVEVELRQDTNNVVTWRINGHLIAQRVNTSPFTNGNVMLGYMDLFTSIASPAEDAFVLFDNVRVEIPAALIPPTITSPPEDVAVYQEEDAEFSVAATGSAPFFYQWLFNGAEISGATNNSYSRLHVRVEDVGAYSAVVSNAAGVAISPAAILTLLDSPYVNTVQATPGSHSALISWHTVIPGDSQVQFEMSSGGTHSLAVAAGQSSFGSSSYRDPEPTTNHVILLTGLSPDTTYSFQTLSRADTNTYVSGVYQFTTAGTIILDNPAATFTGDWTAATSATDKFATNYHFATSVAGDPTATATWRPNITTPGKYNVSVWYPQGGNRANNAPFEISFLGGTTNITVNQQTGGGGWQLLATGLEFAKGTSGCVRLANNANPSVVLADAVRFDYFTAQDFPTNNSIPIWWRDFFFGGPTDLIADPDEDGYHTAREYVMGTNPTNAASRLQFDVASGNSTAQISFWPRHDGRLYQLLARPELGIAPWNEISASPVSAPDGVGFFAFSTTNAPQNFYRLRVNLLPAGELNLLAVPRSSLVTVPFEDQFCGPFRVFVREAAPE
jgi:hypothetical protein